MIRNISYNSKKIDQEINHLVGNQYSFLTRLKMGGNGSKRMIINKWSFQFEKLLNLNSSIKYCSIELRSKGIIIRFRSLLETFAWVIPYRKLVVFQTSLGFSIHAEDLKLTLNRNLNDQNEKSFFAKLMLQRVE